MGIISGSVFISSILLISIFIFIQSIFLRNKFNDLEPYSISFDRYSKLIADINENNSALEKKNNELADQIKNISPSAFENLIMQVLA